MPFRNRFNIGLAPPGADRLFMDYTPYLFPAEMFAPSEFLRVGQEMQQQGLIDIHGVTPRRLERLLSSYAVDTGNGTGLGLTIDNGDGTYQVYYNRFLDQYLRPLAIEHEIAHAGGWNAAHDNQ